MLNRDDRPTRPEPATRRRETFTGNRALQLEEPLLFEVGRTDVTGVDIDVPEHAGDRLGRHRRKAPIGLPALSEPEALRHYVRLSQKNYAIDSGLYPLGSCTMKHNPRLNEAAARLPGFADLHPLAPQATVQGALELIHELGRWLIEITGMHSVAMSPKAGAHGELCGMMAIKAAVRARGEDRTIVLVPESAHGTNPATAALLGFTVVAVPAREDGTVAAAEVRRLAGEHEGRIAAIMLTNPNTCGLFEPEVCEIAAAVHAAGGYFYCDGANLNAILGKVKPGALGVDAMHINLHKTFSTPHGGGGPGAGPVVLSEALAPHAPLPAILRGTDGGYRLVEHAEDEAALAPFGRMTAFHGQMGMFVRAYAWMLSHGADGMRQAAEDAVLNANYVRAGVQDLMSVPYPAHPAMHEALFDDGFLDGTGVTTLDFAKAMIDEGFHPMTVYFPLVVHGAMLVEPTESESRASLDVFVATLRDLAMAAKRGQTERFKDAPRFAPRRRLDETRAARQPVLKWSPPEPIEDAAE
ncbi:aminomethyl-transferring glycine dehydrogenase subunit GcvPB [Propylenella binzhouense]|uniref:glycine dehydrogenase (aminomethyl-transferring) n=1 Tax=Propylenella binzhouense TaxID=2555902 RepID=A0A964T503_9HYPH|nr:aminomethyl-transferring glycine dehydrogenase subunit GcvPB [Propylenella binzhouense]MYZ48568.1 glycine dehydrogenase subunit 2 [Propylenella binzhouense]